MTQTLMNFLQLVAPRATAKHAMLLRDDTALNATLQKARDRLDTRLSRLNRQIRKMGCNGRLIAVPLCPTACTPGDLAEFILSLNTDPFQRWNMMIYADSPATADMLNTLSYQQHYTTDTDTLMVDYISGLQAKRAKYVAALDDHSGPSLQQVSDDMRTRLIDDCRKIEQSLFGQRTRLWQVHSEGTAAAASPPSAVINAAISSGTGTENRI